LALNPHFKLTTRHAMLNTLNASLSTTCFFILYGGVQPADVSSAITAANVHVASLAMTQSSAFAAAAGSLITANAISNDTNAAGGTAGWFSITSSDGTTRFVDGSVGTSGADLNLNSTSITTGATVSITSFTITFAA
jgi:hypothetical protein